LSYDQKGPRKAWDELFMVKGNNTHECQILRLSSSSVGTCTNFLHSTSSSIAIKMGKSGGRAMEGCRRKRLNLDEKNHNDC